MAGVSHEAFPSTEIQEKKNNIQAGETGISFVFKLTLPLNFPFPFHMRACVELFLKKMNMMGRMVAK